MNISIYIHFYFFCLFVYKEFLVLLVACQLVFCILHVKNLHDIGRYFDIRSWTVYFPNIHFSLISDATPCISRMVSDIAHCSLRM